MADSDKIPTEQQQPLQDDSQVDESGNQPQPKPAAPPKEIIATKVSGTVKWFNVKSGYGFINRNDTKEDVFVHQSAIAKNNPKKAVRSVGDGELVEFDVVIGEKGNEAANVTGPSGEPVRGSQFAADKKRLFRGQYRSRRNTQQRRNTNNAETGDEGEATDGGQQQPQQQRPQRNYRRGGRGRGRYINYFGQKHQRRLDSNQGGGGGGGGLSGGEGGNDNMESNGHRGDGQGGQQRRGGPPRRFFRRKFNSGNRGPQGGRRPRSEDGGNEIYQGGQGGQGGFDAPRNPRTRRNPRKQNNGGGNSNGGEQQPQQQDAGQQVQNTTTESSA